MKRKFMFAVIFAVLVTTFAAYGILANTGFKVFVNGTELIYAEGTPQPRIINDRAMLPIVATMQKLSVSVDWNNETGTLIMSKDGNVATHILYSNVVSINGVPKTYPVSSLLQNGEALMPSLMIADIIGCDTIWDGSARAVIMRQKTGAGSGTIPFLPEIISYQTNKDRIYPGDQIVINVIGNENTTNVNLYSSSGSLLASSSSFTKLGNNNSFMIYYTPKTSDSSFLQLSVKAGNANGLNDASAKAVVIAIEQGYSAPPAQPKSSVSINAINFSNKTYNVGEIVSGSVRTSFNVVEISVYDKQTGKSKTYSRYSDSTNGRTFSFSVTPSSSGRNTFEVTAFDTNGNSSSNSFNLSAASTSRYTYYPYYYDYYYGYPYYYYYYYDYPYYYTYYYGDPYYWNYYYGYYFSNYGYYPTGSFISSIESPVNNNTSYGFTVRTSLGVDYLTVVDSAGRNWGYVDKYVSGSSITWRFNSIPWNNSVTITAHSSNHTVLETRTYNNPFHNNASGYESAAYVATNVVKPYSFGIVVVDGVTTEQDYRTAIDAQLYALVNPYGATATANYSGISFPNTTSVQNGTFTVPVTIRDYAGNTSTVDIVVTYVKRV